MRRSLNNVSGCLHGVTRENAEMLADRFAVLTENGWRIPTWVLSIINTAQPNANLPKDETT